MKACYFRKFTDTPCCYRADGLPDPAHLVPQQRLRAEYNSRGFPPSEIAAAIWDRRVVVPSCRAHHNAFDGKRLRLSAEQYPTTMHDYAKEYSWYFAGERDGWRPDRTELAA